MAHDGDTDGLGDCGVAAGHEQQRWFEPARRVGVARLEHKRPVPPQYDQLRDALLVRLSPSREFESLGCSYFRLRTRRP